MLQYCFCGMKRDLSREENDTRDSAERTKMAFQKIQPAIENLRLPGTVLVLGQSKVIR